jgi:hypothetical protein
MKAADRARRRRTGPPAEKPPGIDDRARKKVGDLTEGIADYAMTLSPAKGFDERD